MVLSLLCRFSFSIFQAPDEEFEEHLNHLMGDEFTGDRNEVINLMWGQKMPSHVLYEISTILLWLCLFQTIFYQIRNNRPWRFLWRLFNNLITLVMVIVFEDKLLIHSMWLHLLLGHTEQKNWVMHDASSFDYPNIFWNTLLWSCLLII